ncbi:MAG: cell division protein FtsL [candidate division Zixibacteria bacterium]|nr:cell division protein FtsL [candidate division Zixibacteria bacterium]
MARSVRKFKETVEFRAHPLQRLKSSRYFPFAVIAVVLMAAACVHVWQRVVVISLVQEVSVLERESQGMVDDTHKMQTEITALSMAGRVERYAVDSLGLQRVQPDHLFALTEDEKEEVQKSDEFADMMSSIKRVAEYFPEVSEVRAETQELEPIRFDTAGGEDTLK